MGKEVVILPSRMDLGQIDGTQERSFWFEVTNHSDQEMDMSAWAACGCTTPQIVPSRVPAKGTAKLMIKFDPNGKSGLQEKGVGVTYFLNGVKSNSGATFIAKI